MGDQYNGGGVENVMSEAEQSLNSFHGKKASRWASPLDTTRSKTGAPTLVRKRPNGMRAEIRG